MGGDRQPYRGLELEEDERSVRRDWRFERIGRVVLSLALLAALAGVCGRGPVANATARTRSGNVTLEYDRLERRAAETRLRFRVAPSAVADTVLRLWIARRWLDDVRVERVMPEPSATRDAGGAIVYEFAAQPGRPAVVTFAYQHEREWRHRGEAGLVDGDTLRFGQFVYP